MYHRFLIHLSADGHVGCFHVLTIVNSAAVNIGVHVSLSILVSSGCMRSSGIAGWYGSSQRRQWHPTPVLLPGKSHGWRSLVGYSPWGREESDTTERLYFHFSLSFIGEGNGTHSSILAWRIPWTEEPGRLPSIGSHRVGHD